MDIPQNQNSQAQTGTVGQPIQVENVQYNVSVGSLQTKVALAFSFTSVTLALIVFFAALTVYSVLGNVLGFHLNDFKTMIVAFISMLVPLAPLFFFSNKRLKKIINENPSAIEDVIFKKILRSALILEVFLAVVIITSYTYMVLSILFLENEGSLAQSLSSLIVFGGAFGYLAYWTYTYQELTKR